MALGKSTSCRAIGIATLFLLGATQAAATPAIRAIFVGIDHYRYSKARVATANFVDLRGAVGDVGRMKAALRDTYAIALDVDPPAGCRSANAVSITLTDDCATRAAILAAWQDRIAVSATGDTLIFYFAGHGSRIADDQLFDQGSGMSDTILPTDARQPGAISNADILDRELRGLIDAATARGINIVTIFDSCNSGTGTRGQRQGAPPIGEARDAPTLIVNGLRRPPPPVPKGPGGGYRVHLAAAADWQLARETPTAAGDDTRRGVFTTALAEAMRATPAATFGDLAFATRARVGAAIGASQTPQAEGALNATLGGPDRPTPLFEVTVDKGVPALGAGRLSGITQGSTFALFANATDALDERAQPIATVMVGPPDAFGAPLAFAGKPPGGLPARLVAREMAHAWGSGILRVRPAENTTVTDQRIDTALGALPFVRVARDAPFRIAPSGEGVALFAAPHAAFGIDAAKVADLGAIDGGFDTRVATALHRVARGEALLALANGKAGSRLCVAPGDYDVFTCPTLDHGPRRIVDVNADLKLTVANTGPADRYVYVLLIDNVYGITMMVPRNRGNDPPVPPDQPQQRSFRLDAPGLYRFITITSDTPINAAALEQAGADARDAASGSMSGWTATVTEVTVRTRG